MLNTFENADRHHIRQRERERHMRAMEAFSKDIEYADHSTLFSMVDALSGFPLEKAVAPIETSEPKTRRRRYKYGLIVGALVLICASFIGFLLGIDVGEEDSIPQGIVTPNDNGDTLRRKKIFSLVLDWGVTSREILDDPMTAPARALDWLTYDDVVTNDAESIRTRYALATLFFGTQKPSASNLWTNDRHWLSTFPVCLWHGIECLDEHTTTGLVKALNLSSNGLVGTLPDEIGLLELDIRSFDVSNNAIEGTIPETIFLMKNLADLYLGPNLFSSTLPSRIGELEVLTHLYINSCGLDGAIPAEIGRLTNLQGLGLHDNALTGTIPESIGQMEDLAVLYLDDNKLSGKIPSTLGMLSNLVDLRLRLNMLSGSLPAEIAGLRILQICYLDSNRLGGSLPSKALGSLRLLHELHLYDNEFIGTLPTELGNLQLLRVIYLDGNRFTGTIPEAVGLLRHIESVYVFDNVLSGGIPISLGLLSNLEQFRAQENQISGEIPEELGILENLSVLLLQNNTLSGTVPWNFGGLTSLTSLQLHGNHLSGSIPMKVCVLASFVLHDLTADCDLREPEVECKCCTRCYHD